MNIVNDIPDVKDTARYTIAQASALLGINRSTLYRRIKKPTRGQRIKTIISRLDGKPKIEGKEIKRIWYAYV